MVSYQRLLASSQYWLFSLFILKIEKMSYLPLIFHKIITYFKTLQGFLGFWGSWSLNSSLGVPPLELHPHPTDVFCGTGIWTQGFALASRHSTAWVTPPVHFALVILEIRGVYGGVSQELLVVADLESWSSWSQPFLVAGAWPDL
jgi:hypothetical protein